MINTPRHDPVVFVDTETTGLDPDVHEIWEVAVVYNDPHPNPHWVATEYRFPPLNLATAQPDALRVNRFYDRWPVAPGPHIRHADGRASSKRNTGAWDSADPDFLARLLARSLADKHLVGNVPGFDAAFLDRLLRRYGLAPAWHYHLIDVEALAVGYLNGLHHGRSDHKAQLLPPWDSETISEQLDVDPEWFDRHTALGDALWAAHVYYAVMHGRDFDFGTLPATGYRRRR